MRLKFEVDLGVDHYYHNLDISKHDPDEELVDFGVKRPKIEIIEVEVSGCLWECDVLV